MFNFGNSFSLIGYLKRLILFLPSSGLYYKQALHGHLSVNLLFCVINLKSKAKYPLKRIFGHFYGHLTMKVHIKADFFLVN